MTFSLEKYFSKWSGQLIFSFLLVGIVLMPALSGSKVFGQDATQLFIPQLAFYKEAFTSGGSPFWNPYIAVGFPNFVDVVHPFSPTVWLVRLLSPISAHYWTLFILLSLALFFCISFLREMGISIAGSLIGGMSYLIFGVWYAQSALIAVGIFLQAVLFWALIKIFKINELKRLAMFIAIGGLSVGTAWLSIGYWYTLYLFFAGLAFAIFLSFRDKSAARRAIICFFFIYGIGTLIGLLQVIPTYLIAQFSGRGGGLDYETAKGYAIGFKELFNFFHFTPNRGLEAYLYMGVVPLILFVISFFSKNSSVKFFRWLFVVAFVIAIKWSPLFWLINKLPIFNYFQGAARFLILGAISTVVLVGFGADFLSDLLKQMKASHAKRLFNVVVFSVACLMLLTIMILQSRQVFSSLIFSAIFLALTYVASRFFFQKPSLLLFILALITAADFIFVFYSFYGSQSIERLAYERKPLTAQFFQKNTGRILPVFVDDWDDAYFYQLFEKSAPPAEEASYLFDLLYETYHPNLQLLSLVENLEANEPLLNVEMGRMMALLGTRQLVTTGGEEKLNKLHIVKEDPQKLTDISVAEKYKLLKERLPLIDFLGIRYLLSAYGPKGSNIELPVKAFAELKIMGEGLPPMPMFIYENPNARPLTYFSKITDFKENDESAYKAFKESGFDGIFVTCGDCEKKSFTAEGEVHLEKKENGKVILKTSSLAGQFMVFTQNYLPGWKALIDGEEVPIYKVNSVFTGVFVPAGSHSVEFVYDYWSLFDPGLLFRKK